jgi:cytochrome c553
MLSKRILCLGALTASLFGTVPVSAEVVPEATDGFYCTTCHGTDGQGNVAIDAPRIAGMERWYLERQMDLFRDGLRGTHPEDLTGQEMQPMAAILDDEKLERVLDWVGEWEYEPAEPTLTGGNARNGRSLYQSCVACHGAEGEGREMMNAPALAGQSDWYLVQQLKNCHCLKATQWIALLLTNTGHRLVIGSLRGSGEGFLRGYVPTLR